MDLFFKKKLDKRQLSALSLQTCLIFLMNKKYIDS
jgi:hypothetical protein